jgi:hypothetical protein
MTHNVSGIVIDAKSGISEEEQREILAQIDNIAEKNRLSLSEGSEEKNKNMSFKAKKSGGRFPVIVNIAAFVTLAAGLTFLLSMYGKTNAHVRTGAKIYNSAERALIEEIRRDTTSLADSELERLNIEQYRSAAIESQMGAFFANLNSQISGGRLDEAAGTIKAMRDFINTPAFQSLRSIQERKNLYVQAISSFETMVEDTKKYQTGGAGITERNTEGSQSGLQDMITRLQKDLAEKDKTIEALGSGSSATRRLTEENGRLGKTNSDLQAENGRLEKLESDSRNRVSSLEADVITLQQTERNLQADNTRQAQTIANRNEVITRIRNEVELDRDYDEIPPAEIKTRITRIQTALRSLQ